MRRIALALAVAVMLLPEPAAARIYGPYYAAWSPRVLRHELARARAWQSYITKLHHMMGYR